MSDQELIQKVQLLKRLAWLALAGAVAMVGALALSEGEPSAWVMIGTLLVVPAALYVIVLTIWHWKARYIGSHSNLWGGIFVIETSGWMKLVYLFRHVLPDARGAGRYQRARSEAS